MERWEVKWLDQALRNFVDEPNIEKTIPDDMTIGDFIRKYMKWEIL